ncbi:MAG: ECF transporter S component [Propionibacteriaceae bacterium]|jgi:energy-coupling factor transport system substrate-specific component|nr:ECF transporter S component [Propionibacteriaceae bacterium]
MSVVTAEKLPNPSQNRSPARLIITMVAAVIVGLTAFLWPLFTSPDAIASGAQAPLLFSLVIPLVLVVVLAELSDGMLDVKALAMLGVLAAVGSVLRPLSAGLAGFELVFFLLILGGRVFGAGFGFALGSVTMLTSALLTAGVGPWLPYQMIAGGFVGLFAGLLPQVHGRLELALLAGYGVVVAFLFGFMMDLAFWPFAIGGNTELSFDAAATPLENLHHFILFDIATSMGWNVGRALTNAGLLLLLSTPLLRLLRRTARRADFGTS